MMGCPDTPPDFSRLRENDFSQFAMYTMPGLTEMCLEELWELCAGKSSLSCFSQFFSAEPTRLTENKMEWPDFIASHFWEVITAMLLQLVFSQFHACKRVKVTEIIFEGTRSRATDREQATGNPI